MTVVAYGVDLGVERLLNVVKGYGKPPTPPLLLPKSPQKSRLNRTQEVFAGLILPKPGIYLSGIKITSK
jgi:hypothetical protein